MSGVKCPRCGQEVQELMKVGDLVLQKLREAGGGENIPAQVCGSCSAKLTASIAKGSNPKASDRIRENKKMMLWKSRVGLIKKARASMNEKAFSDAAVAYEKYIRVLEMVFDTKPGELSPDHFKESARTKELTVLATTYWDLLRIYDTSDKYGDRQMIAAKKLALFLRYTPLLPDILKKARSYVRTARNPSAIKAFLKAAQEGRGRCFIATSAFEGYEAPEVIFLQNFRDQKLEPFWFGRCFVRLYVLIAPFFAMLLDKLSLLKPLVRFVLRLLIRFLAQRQ